MEKKKKMSAKHMKEYAKMAPKALEKHMGQEKELLKEKKESTVPFHYQKKHSIIEKFMKSFLENTYKLPNIGCRSGVRQMIRQREL